ncbi:MAG: helix-turn-helix domain-containing protein [Deltaproteobacteria bacterium]|nr:helix-turn-helix domain-containing protein [Deltaproteobacteria bacterium]
MDYSVKSKDGGPIIIELKVKSPLTIQTSHLQASNDYSQEFQKTIKTVLQEWLKGTADEKGDPKILPPLNSYILEDEAARITGFAVQTLRNNRYKGLGFPYYKIGRSVRYKVKDILDYMEKFKVQNIL